MGILQLKERIARTKARCNNSEDCNSSGTPYNVVVQLLPLLLIGPNRKAGHFSFCHRCSQMFIGLLDNQSGCKYV